MSIVLKYRVRQNRAYLLARVTRHVLIGSCETLLKPRNILIRFKSYERRCEIDNTTLKHIIIWNFGMKHVESKTRPDTMKHAHGILYGTTLFPSAPNVFALGFNVIDFFL